MSRLGFRKLGSDPSGELPALERLAPEPRYVASLQQFADGSGAVTPHFETGVNVLGPAA